MHHSEVCRYSPLCADPILCAWVGVTSGPWAGEERNVHEFASPLPLSPPARGASFRFDARPGDFDLVSGPEADAAPSRQSGSKVWACGLAVVETVVQRRDPMARLRRPACRATVSTAVAVPPASSAGVADALACTDERAGGAWPMGSVGEGVDEARRDAFLSAGNVDDRTPCSDCWARYLCGGGCAFAAHAATGDHRTPDASDCELVRRVAELGMWLLTEAWVRLGWQREGGMEP